MRKLLDDHVKASGTQTLTELVNIFDVEKFDEEVARLQTPVAKADTILNRVNRTAFRGRNVDTIVAQPFCLSAKPGNDFPVYGPDEPFTRYDWRFGYGSNWLGWWCGRRHR